MITKEKFMSMSEQERKDALLDSTSDAIRKITKDAAMLKAITCAETEVTQEDFDKAFEREMAKAWDRVKDKNELELAFMAMADLVSHGVNPSDLIEGVE